jgi:phospholipid-binding lipoprotein MlaA
MYKKCIKRCVSMAMAAWLACTPVAVSAQEAYDPLEPVNRAVFSFNEFLDVWFLQPKIKFYKHVVPVEGRKAVSNVFRNLRMPVVFFNSVLQGDPENAFSAFWTFMLNTTFGIGGVFDFAGTATNLQVHPEDFGQTLGVWGVGEGFYLVLPILGPSNIRDTGGMVADFGMDPYNMLQSREAIIVRMVLEGLDMRYRADDAISDVYATSLDPYSTFRSAYTQHRKAAIKNNAVE